MNEIRLDKEHPLYREDLRHSLKIAGIEELKGKSILITGATGLIGLFMIDALMLYNKEEGAGIQVYAVGRSKEKAANRLGEYLMSISISLSKMSVNRCQPHFM